ncbi:hypothetical protein SRABI80_03696 [Peribacillus frigoritolerans]|nr:hypothetical protein SRABI80_03696 [Peribacillus frigoritolerans]
MGPFFVWALIKALFVKIVVFKTKLFKVDWSGSARLLREHRPPRGKRASGGEINHNSLRGK